MNLAFKHAVLFCLAIIAGACGSWIVSEYYSPRTGLTAPIIVSAIVVVLQGLFSFLLKSNEEKELALIHEARVIEREAHNNTLVEISKQMHQAIQNDDKEKYEYYAKLYKDNR